MTTFTVEPLTRVEGNGRVELTPAADGSVGVRVVLAESSRLFEGVVLGRPWHEVPGLVCRICSICSGVHRLAAVTALERALLVSVPPAARLVRELLLLGGQIESHALHLFCLILPDLAGSDDLLTLLRQGDATAAGGIELKRFGNRIQELAGGRVIHPVNIEVGGVMALPGAAQLDQLRAACAAWHQRLPQLLSPLRRADAYPPSILAPVQELAVDGGATFALSGEALRLSDGRRVAADDYRALLGETVLPHSGAKYALGNELPFYAGAQARLTLYHRSTAADWAVPPGCGIHGNNLAQASELEWALSRLDEVLEALAQLPAAAPLQVAVRPRAGSGTALFEAPRGLLIHHYALDEFGRVAAADIVTPTAINQRALEAQLAADLCGLADPEELCRRAERIVRAYDPCISCAVHLLKPG